MNQSDTTRVTTKLTHNAANPRPIQSRRSRIGELNGGMGMGSEGNMVGFTIDGKEVDPARLDTGRARRFR